ncbi:alpha/beta hydrolase [candidate division KSB1 bacterium]
MKKLYLFPVLILSFSIFNCKTPIPNDSQSQAREIYFVSEATKELSYFLIFSPQQAKSPLPVLYLLNGGGANPYAWISGANLQKEADKHGMIIVSLTTGMTGNYEYVNSLVDTTKKYEDYVLEIIKIVDDNYDTKNSRYFRGIGGISNGAIGALYIASRNPGIFISASALSGGTYGSYFPEYDNFREINLLIDIGTDDNLIGNVRELHDTLVSRDILHEYNEYPGGHNWAFWGAHYKEHMSFHNGIFDKYR